MTVEVEFVGLVVHACFEQDGLRQVEVDVEEAMQPVGLSDEKV